MTLYDIRVVIPRDDPNVHFTDESHVGVDLAHAKRMGTFYFQLLWHLFKSDALKSNTLIYIDLSTTDQDGVKDYDDNCITVVSHGSQSDRIEIIFGQGHESPSYLYKDSKMRNPFITQKVVINI
jgi:hypothetical protein